MTASNDPKPERVVDASGNLRVPSDYRTAYKFLGSWAVAVDQGQGAKEISTKKPALRRKRPPRAHRRNGRVRDCRYRLSRDSQASASPTDNHGKAFVKRTAGARRVKTLASTSARSTKAL